MKTTLNIDDTVMQRLREEAARRGTTMSSLVEAGIRHVLEGHPQAEAGLAGPSCRPGAAAACSWMCPIATSCTGSWKKIEVLAFDTNVLIYAVDEDSTFHGPCLRLLEEALADPSPAFLTWNVCYEFLRVSTHPRVLRSPRNVREAWRFIETLLDSQGFHLLTATDRHSAVMSQTLIELPDIRGTSCTTCTPRC